MDNKWKFEANSTNPDKLFDLMTAAKVLGLDSVDDEVLVLHVEPID